ncbi:MAG: hypothetical protein FJY95_21565 [Candidatus Handelsmanbacteria bacterium]|nr:hypothetical protein [Candidatus Handelsmanbacteria bacterium]
MAVAQYFGGVMAGMIEARFRPENRQYAAAGYGAFIAVFGISRFLPVEAFRAEADRSVQLWAEVGIPLGPTHQQSLAGDRRRAWAGPAMALRRERIPWVDLRR